MVLSTLKMCNHTIWYELQPIKRKKEGEEKRMTQEEMLLEAAQTGFDSYHSVLGNDL